MLFLIVHFVQLNVVHCSESLQILWGEFFLLEFDAVRSIYSQIVLIFSSDAKNFQSGKFLENFQVENSWRKIAEYLGINASHGIKFQQKKFIP